MLSTYDRDGVTVVELDRGPVNALDLELLGALTAAFERADSPVVLTGAGRTFSAGVDLRRIVEEPDSYVAEFLAALARAFLAVFTHPRPTVAAINGHAIAGGCLFALCCDTRVMGAGTIGLTELAVGVRFPRSGGCPRSPRRGLRIIAFQDTGLFGSFGLPQQYRAGSGRAPAQD